MGIISNLFGSRKKEYRRGLQDAMNAYETFGNKQEKALNKIREEVRDGNKRMEDMLNAFGEDINGIYDYLTDQEKVALYNLCTPKDVNTLDEAEKRVLIAILYQLISIESEDRITDYQRKYIRSIQSYLGITNPQMEIDLQTIENIDSNDVQKAMLQVVLEFLYLQKVKNLSDEQEEFLSCFSLNQRQAKQIEDYVIKLYRAVGEEGICEKYGLVPKDCDYVCANACSPSKGKLYDVISFGKWDEEEIIWRIMEVDEDDNVVLLVSEYLYDMGSYGYEDSPFWCKSRLRGRLNHDFFEKAFTDDEKKLIQETYLNNKKDYVAPTKCRDYGSWENENTTDKIFILSRCEINDLLEKIDEDNNYSRKDFLVSIWKPSGNACEWWTRSVNARKKYYGNLIQDVYEDDTGHYYDVGRVTAEGRIEREAYAHRNFKPITNTDAIKTRMAMRVNLEVISSGKL